MTRWQRQRDPTYYRRERKIVRTSAQSYDRYDADRRFRSLIAADRVYVAVVLAAAFVAFCAGSGFGRLHSFQADDPVSLFALAAAGTTCALALRRAVVTTSEVPPRKNRMAQGALLAIFFAYLVLPPLLRGEFDLIAAAMAAVLLLILWLLLGSNFQNQLPAYLLIPPAFGFVLASYVRAEIGPQFGWGVATGIALVLFIYALAWWGRVRVQPAGVISQLAAVLILWTVLCGGTVSQRSFDSGWTLPTLAAGVLSVVVVALFWQYADRHPGWSVAFGVAGIHLAGAACAPQVVFESPEPHLAAAVVEFALVVVAGARIWRARVESTPPGNFLNSPRCWVPHLDRALGFSLESDVVE
jgi:hypothetical protein